MKSMITMALFAALACVAMAEEAPELTDANFEASITNGESWFVKFYAPWCGHCKRLAPTWDRLASENKDTKGVHVVKVDCTRSKDVCTSQGIRGYPTLKLFTGGNREGAKYAGGRDLGALSDYLKTHAAAPKAGDM